MPTQGQVRVIARERFGDPLDEGPTLVRLVRNMAPDARGWLAVVVRDRRIELLDPRPFAGPGLQRWLGGLTRSEALGEGPARAVGIAGHLEVRRTVRGSGRAVAPSPVAIAFLEVPDCDWWMWQRFLGPLPDGIDDEQVLAGQRGDALPNGVGRWWSLGRRSGVRVRLDPVAPARPPIASSPLVH